MEIARAIVTFQFQPEAPVLVGNLVVAITLIGYTVLQYHRRGHTPELLSFIVLLFSIGLWQLSTIFHHIVTEPALILAGINFGNVVTALLFSYSLAWFALTYSGRERWVNRWTGGFALATIGLTSIMLIVYPELFTEVNEVSTVGPVTIGGITFAEWIVIDRTIEPAFRVFALYNYVITLSSGAIFGQYLLQNRGDIYTGQAVALIVGAGTPIAVSTVPFLGISPPRWNLTNIAFGVTAVGFAVAMFRYPLFTLVPVGRKQLVEEMADPVIMLNHSHDVVDCNPAARELVNAPVGWRGMSAATFFEPLPESVDWFTTSGSGEITLSEADTERCYTMNSVRIENDANTQTGQLVRLHEITEQKARERQLREQNENLDEFASIVSHDLQGPLNVAKGRVKLAEKECESEQLAEVDEALTRMESLIDDLLTKAQSNQSTDEPEPVALETVARTAWEYSDIGDCTFSTSIPAEVLIVADRDRLLELFQNLYQNSREHNESPVSVHVGVIGPETQSSDDNKQAGFYVADDGSGIPNDSREDLFEKGYTTNTNGTGLGLAIVKDIIGAHGWEIAVTDSEDGGARFEITGVEFTTD